MSDPHNSSGSSTVPSKEPDGSNPCRICSSAQAPDAKRCQECGVEWPIDTFLGQVLDGDVRIDDVLGRGGMAMVYLATQLRLDREVAVKRLLPSRQVSSRDADWFRQEARVLSQLRHPNLVSVLDFGAADDGSLYLVMEYVRGTSLRQATRGKAVNAPRALNLLFQMLAALEEVHRRDIVHRDIKPQNVLIEAVAGEKDFVKLADFGVAHIVTTGSDNGKVGLDPSGPIGTPAYMAPEQIRCDPVDRRADIYAAGILLFELLTAALPHGNAGPSQMLIRRASEPADAPSVVRPELPIAADLDAICLRALALDPEDRYQTAAEFRADVKRALEDRRSARPRPPEGAGDPRRGPERHWTVLALRPRVDFQPSSGVRTQVERLMLVWDLVDRYATDHGGVMTAPDGPTGFVLFQDPPNSTAIARAASTALALIHKVSVHFPDTQVACGIARGPVPGFQVGGGPPPEAACLSVARSLARAAGAGHIRVDEAQASRLTGAYQQVRVDGDLEVVSGPGGRGRTSPEFTTPDDSSPNLNMRSTLSGRAVAWDRVSEALSSIRANRPGAVFLLTGPAGVGKSQLCENVMTVSAPGTPAVRAEAHPGLDDRPYRPILELIAQMAVPQGESVTRNSLMDGLLVLGVPTNDAKVIAGQWESGTRADPWVAMNQGADGHLPPENLLRALHLAGPLERKMAFTSAVSTFARTVAGPSGCVFILEDIDRADEATIAAIDGFAHASKQAPVLLLLTARSERMKERVDAGWLEVATLSTDDRIALWASMSPQERDPAVTREVLRASEGLPLYLRHACKLGPGSTGSLDDVLAMSLATLTQSDQILLVRAAAIGECFRAEWITGDNRAGSALRLLTDWVRPMSTAGWWRFLSASLYNVARLGSSDQQRLAVRQDAFARMESDGSAVLPRAITAHRISNAQAACEAATELGDRFLIAGAPRRAADWYRIARGAGEGRPDVLRLKTGIAEFAGRRNRVACEELAPAHFESSPLALVAAHTMVRASLSDGDLDTARTVATAALQARPTPGAQSAELLLLLAEVHVRTDEPEPALRAVETTEKIWQACGDDAPPGLGWRSALAAGRVYQLLGDSATASRYIVLATRRATEEMDEAGLIQCLTHTAAIALREGRGGQLRAVCDNIFGGAPPRQVSHRVLWWRIRGQACGAAGDLEAARECFERASTLASAAGGHVARDLQKRLASNGDIPNPSRWVKSRKDP